MSSGGQKVVLGRYLTQEQAEVDFARIQEEKFYTKAKIVEAKLPPPVPDDAAES